MKENSKPPNGRPPSRDWGSEVITRGKLDSFLEDIKEHIKSAAKGTETVLTERMGERFERVEAAISTHSGMIKELGEKIDALDTRLTGVETRLTDKIDSIHTRLDDHEVRISTLETPAKS